LLHARSEESTGFATMAHFSDAYAQTVRERIDLELYDTEQTVEHSLLSLLQEACSDSLAAVTRPCYI